MDLPQSDDRFVMAFPGSRGTETIERSPAMYFLKEREILAARQGFEPHSRPRQIAKAVAGSHSFEKMGAGCGSRDGTCIWEPTARRIRRAVSCLECGRIASLRLRASENSSSRASRVNTFAS